MDDDLLKKLTELASEQKSFREKIDAELKSFGAALPETKTALDGVNERLTKVQTQLDAVDAKTTERAIAGAQEEESAGDEVLKSDAYALAKGHGFAGRAPIVIHLKRGAFALKDGFYQRKATITDAGLGSGVSGLLMPVRLPGLAITPMQELRIRDLMTIRTLTQGNSFEWVKQLTRTNAASPQIEAAAKSESTYSWVTASDQVRTIAHFVNVSRQALDDIPWLRNEIDAELIYGLKIKEEAEILAGVGTGEHLNGLITQATAYNTGYNVSGDTKLDKLRHAKLQARLQGLATYAPDGIVVHPTDMHTIELIKDQASNVGNYVIGDPKGGTAIKTVWGLPVVESDSMAAGTFLVGSFARAAELIDRLTATVEISFEHDTNFTKNLATILCEERIGLAVKKADAFIYGSY